MHYKVNVNKIIRIQALYRGIKSRRMYEMLILTSKVIAALAYTPASEFILLPVNIVIKQVLHGGGSQGNLARGLLGRVEDLY